MRPTVRDAWLEFTEGFEGGVACLYNDVRGLTTIAYGNLCNSPGEAAALPLVHPDGTFATSAEKVAAWTKVHNDLRAAAAGWRYAATLTSLRLTRDGMANLALRRLDMNDTAALARFPDWESYPACAQAALHSLWWACGSAVHYPRLYSSVLARDWDVCSVEITMNEWTPEGIRNAGLIPRNVANKILMLNAHRVEAYQLDPDTLDWHAILGVSDTPTLPELVQLNTPIMGQESAATLPTCYPQPADTMTDWPVPDEPPWEEPKG